MGTRDWCRSRAAGSGSARDATRISSNHVAAVSAGIWRRRRPVAQRRTLLSSPLHAFDLGRSCRGGQPRCSLLEHWCCDISSADAGMALVPGCWCNDGSSLTAKTRSESWRNASICRRKRLTRSLKSTTERSLARHALCPFHVCGRAARCACDGSNPAALRRPRQPVGIHCERARLPAVDRCACSPHCS